MFFFTPLASSHPQDSQIGAVASSYSYEGGRSVEGDKATYDVSLGVQEVSGHSVTLARRQRWGRSEAEHFILPSQLLSQYLQQVSDRQPSLRAISGSLQMSALMMLAYFSQEEQEDVSTESSHFSVSISEEGSRVPSLKLTLNNALQSRNLSVTVSPLSEGCGAGESGDLKVAYWQVSLNNSQRKDWTFLVTVNNDPGVPRYCRLPQKNNGRNRDEDDGSDGCGWFKWLVSCFKGREGTAGSSRGERQALIPDRNVQTGQSELMWQRDSGLGVY